MIDEIRKYQTLLTEQGRADLVRAMHAFRDAYGEKWLVEFKTKNPDYVLIMDLAANHDFATAYVQLRNFVIEKIEDAESGFFKRQALIASANLFIDGARGELQIVHGLIKAEIDKPRV